jgi:hypothetical protein
VPLLKASTPDFPGGFAHRLCVVTTLPFPLPPRC